MLPLAGLSLGGLFRLDPAGPTTLDAIAILHITDVHADPLYDVSWYGCGHKGCTRNLTWQDAKGKPTKNLCSSSGKTERVAGQCGPWDGSHESMAKFWKEMIQPGPMCPCGVAFSNPPYSVIPPLRAALEEFAQDGFASQAAIYTGDLAGHFMPGTSEQLEAAGCTTAKAVMKSTIEMLSVEGVEHFFVLGNNDVIPKNRPLSEEWLHELGGFLQERRWLTAAEREPWDAGGFFWRKMHTTGLCSGGWVYRLVLPAKGTAPPPPPRAVSRLRPLLRGPERRRSSLYARHGLRNPPQPQELAAGRPAVDAFLAPAHQARSA
jgi:hypothetical protein